MKKSIFTVLLASATLFTFAGGDGHSFNVDSKSSEVKWLGSSIGKEHYGLVNIKSGHLDEKGGKIVGGEFTIDLNTIKDTDLEGEWAQKLEGHLKAPDFFDVAKFPTATIKITKIDGDNVTADLTIKGKTNSISFPAKINIDDHDLSASTEFTIDRSKWDVKYGSDSFFDDLGDKVISNDITFTIALKASAH